ncbi:hypothetical protein DM01DRAFT_1330943 [Hesseltinella vesiculosa]|uniref:Nudix hydrolase domain-containing protein n=1 Tax=Hesseltinella vesiculosa TaxID=101127 RepID=A0A1X2GXK8_9FUNG|nr:hypothetical protein DM01DRAFT_1330943 [Hesseltinella vesiculosa]
MYELPGGHVEPTDATILDAVVRETKEETGLTIASIDTMFSHFDYHSREAPGLSHQLNFRVHVDPPLAVTLAPAEHQAYQWISLDHVDSLETTEPMQKLIREALAS